MSKKLTPAAFTVALLCAAASSVSASTFVWDGSHGTVWAEKQNWTQTPPPAVPAGTDLAQFNAATANQPSVAAPGSAIGEIQFVSTAAATFTIGGAGPLTINGIGGVGIVNE